MGEILLCLKDSNGKTREVAYQLLLVMAHARNNIANFFKIVMAGLGAKTPHMRSATVLALSRLVYECAREDMAVHGLLPARLKSHAQLLTSRKIVRPNNDIQRHV